MSLPAHLRDELWFFLFEKRSFLKNLQHIAEMCKKAPIDSEPIFGHVPNTMYFFNSIGAISEELWPRKVGQEKAFEIHFLENQESSATFEYGLRWTKGSLTHLLCENTQFLGHLIDIPCKERQSNLRTRSLR